MSKHMTSTVRIGSGSLETASMIRVAFAMEQSLGNATYYENLRAEEHTAPWLEATWMPIAYRATRLPWALHCSLAARARVQPLLEDADAVFMHTTTAALLSPTFCPRRPLVLSTDGAPDKLGMRHWYNLRPEDRLTGQLKRRAYRAVFRRAAGVVAWSDWAKSALVDRYGVDAERVVVIPPGVDVRRFTPSSPGNKLPVILFVGADFTRKGGDLLLDVFRSRLRGKAELTIVTTDWVAPEPGVNVYRGIRPNSNMLRRLFSESDIFALPTRGDLLPLAVAEALASGLPVVTTRVGAADYLVDNGRTGELIDKDCAAQLGDALEGLIIDPARRYRMSASARADAEARFDSSANALKVFEFIRSVV